MGQPWDVVPKLGESATGGWGTPRLAASAELSGLDTLAFTEEVLPRLRDTPGVAVDTSGDIADYREAEEAPWWRSPPRPRTSATGSTSAS